jgi:hypothetical protein
MAGVWILWMCNVGNHQNLRCNMSFMFYPLVHYLYVLK